MIVAEVPGGLRMITQNDHAHWGYQLLSVWPALATHPRRQAILRATRLHDRGWRGIDSSPVIDHSGRPHDFRSLPGELRTDVWLRGVLLDHAESSGAESRGLIELESGGRKPVTAREEADFRIDDAWCEVLIAHHAWTIHRPDRGSDERLRPAHHCQETDDTKRSPGSLGPSDSAKKAGRKRNRHVATRDAGEVPLVTALASERDRQLEQLRRQLEGSWRSGSDPSQHSEPLGDADPLILSLEDDYHWLRAMDFLSLIACHGWRDPVELGVRPARGQPSTAKLGNVRLEPFTAHYQDSALFVIPFPLRGSVSLPIRCRTVPNRPFASNSDLALTLARSPWQTSIVRVIGAEAC